MAVDLHLHSTFSDGSNPPEILVDMAVAAGLSTMALTDHDGFEGIAAARESAAGRIGFIPGVELSVSWGERNMHLLVYWVDVGSPLDARLDAIRESRTNRNERIIEALNELGHDITVEEVLTISGEGVVGRPHIAQALMDRGVVGSVSEAFDTFLASGRPAYRDRLRLHAEDAVGLARQSGAVTSVAHPHTVADDVEEFSSAFEGIAALGIDGVECWYSEYPVEQRKAMARWADDLGLVATGGSDHHGTTKPGLGVGTGYGDLRVPDEVVERLASRRTEV